MLHYPLWYTNASPVLDWHVEDDFLFVFKSLRSLSELILEVRSVDEHIFHGREIKGFG